MMSDTVTVLTSLSRPLTKTIIKGSAGGIETRTQQNVKFYRGEEFSVSGIRDFAELLEKISPDPRKCVVRGAIAPGTDRERMLRRKFPKSGEQATLIETPRRWILFDVDGVALPSALDPLASPTDTVKLVRAKLPPCFHDVTCWYQYTGSAGIKPGLHIRIGFWLDRSLDEAELKQWLGQKVPEPGKAAKTWFREYPVDPAVFTTVQPIYVAAPIVEAGAQDPLAGRCARSGVIGGTAEIVAVPHIETHPAELAAEGAASAGPIGATFAECLAAIGDHEGGAGCHNALKHCVAVYWRRHGSNASAEKLKRLLLDRVAAAEWNAAHPPSYRRMELERIDTLIDSVRGQQRASEQGEEERRARASCPWPGPGMTLAEAEPALRRSIARFFDQAIPDALIKREAYEEALEEHLATVGPASAELEFGQIDPDSLFAPDVEPEPPDYAQWGIRITPGAGKTHAAIERIVRYVQETGRSVVYAVPTHSKAEEIEADINRLAGETIAATWRGIDREDPSRPGVKLCRRGELVKAVVKSSGSINDVCGSPSRGFCPFRDDCGYRQQADLSPRVWVTTHAALATKPQGSMKDADALIVDEALTLSSAREDDLPLSDFSAPRKEHARVEGWLRRAQAAAERVTPGSYLPREPFEAEGLTEAACAALSAGEAYGYARVAKTFDPRADDDTIQWIIEPVAIANGQVRIRQTFWRTLAELLGGEEPTSARMKLLAGDEQAIRIVTPARPHPDWLRRPILHLDATLNETVVSTWLPRFELMADIRVEQGEGVLVHQIVDQAVSYGRVVPGAGGDKSPEKRSAQENNARRIMRAIEVKAADDRRAGGKTGAIAPKSLEEYMEETWRVWKTRPPNLILNHYGNIRGRNNLEDCAREILISRPEPQAGEVERAVRLEFGRHPSASVGAGFYPDRVVALRSRGNAVVAVEQPYHPDQRADALLGQVRDAEVTQAVHRARPVRRGKDRPLILEIVAGVQIDITVDSTGTFEEWLETSPARLLLARGFWPTSWEGKQAALADLYPTPTAVRRWFEKNPTEMELREGVDQVLAAKGALRPYRDILIRLEGTLQQVGLWSLYRYKIAGSRRSHLVAVDQALHPDGAKAWSDRLGNSLEIFERVGEAIQPPAAESCPPLVLRLPRAPSIASDIFGTDRRDRAAAPFPTAPLHVRTAAGDVRFWPAEDEGRPILARTRLPPRPAGAAEPVLTVESICDHLGISRFALKNHMGKSRFRKLIGADRERAAIQWMTLKVGREQFVSAVRALAEQMREAERA
ncbi:hypothetical protein MA20_21305 [Bradyrhizobium japonicum]|uniref:RepB-like DNA primase domain-containing protein n=1 Tax=Bradyrhizobium japonicum TaxID=375 RepID=A0A0A3XRT4_BRAJP|nr:hypothetical protein [Bradyrhizobium japonicum]KGT77152.1 hypothetical protein MA20_21305 [Bradyrhizobium japonicum]